MRAPKHRFLLAVPVAAIVLIGGLVGGLGVATDARAADPVAGASVDPAASQRASGAAAANGDASPAVAAIGEPAPDFTLADTDGQTHRLSDYTAAGKIVVLEWFNPDCPFIKKHHASHKTMNELYATYADQGVVWLAINSGAPQKQGHGLERNRKARQDYEIPFPVLLDEAGTVGRAYAAKTTPHMYVIDTRGVLRYMGAIDDNNDINKLGEKNYVAAALRAVIAGDEVAEAVTRPYGCSVKYARLARRIHESPTAEAQDEI